MKSILILILLLFSISAWAYRLTPMVQTFSSSGKGATKTFAVVNDGGEDISLEVFTTNRHINETGEETREKTDDFMVYPPQFTLKAGERRSIRVSYVKSSDLKVEAPYRLVVRQLPVDLDKKDKKKAGARIDFMYEYVASLYVEPEGVKPSIKLEQNYSEGGSLTLIFRNEGTKHALLRDYKFFVAGGGSKKKLDAAVIKTLSSVNLLPGATRKVIITRPKSMKKNEIITVD